MANVLNVIPDTVLTGLMSDVEADPGFEDKFVLDFSEDNPNDWSRREDISETDSVFSIESVQDLK